MSAAMRIHAWAVVAAVLAWAGSPSPGETTTRPKIGLALAGGAALGLSHIGVLQWMEEHRIPIDFIAGTSMGGLVAGMYASGLNSAEIIQFVDHIDWQSALSPSSKYRNLSFRRKQDATQFPTAIELGLRDGKLNLPSGLSPGEGVALVIDRFAASYGDMKSFDDLPTPFRCVATDLVAGKPVVFDKGSLFDALRATMSLPALFAPVRKGGMVLVDGGLSDNLPVDIVRAMGADIVIAVALDVPADPKDFQSLLGIAGRSISYMISRNERPSMAAADLVLMPLLKGLSGADYPKAEQFRKTGYAAAEQKAALLKQFQVGAAQYETYANARRARCRPDTIRPAHIVVEGEVAPRLKKAVIAALTPEPGEPLDRAVLEDQMEKLTGVGRFDSATYEFRNRGGEETLIVTAQEKSYGPPFLRPAIFLDGANGEGLRFGAGVRFTFLDLGGPASEWRTDLRIGTHNRAETEYYYRISGGKWFVAPRAGYTQEPFPIYDRKGSRIEGLTERNYAGGVDLGYAFGRVQELRIGHQEGYLKTGLETGLMAPQRLSGRYGMSSMALRRDTRDNPLVPFDGVYLAGKVSWFNRYPQVPRQFAAYEGTASYSRPFHARYSLLTRLTAASTVNAAGVATMYRLGGVPDMSALSRQQLLGNRMYYGGAYVLRSLSGNTIATFGKFYGVIGYEVGNAWFAGRPAKPRQDGLIGVAGATQLGAVFFGGAVGDQGARKLLFRVGRVF